MKKILFIALSVCLFGLLARIEAKEIALPDIGDSAGALISPQQEYAIGLSFYWHLQQSVKLVDDPEINHYLRQLGYRLVANSDAPYLRFTFFMVQNPTVNAFAAPGGFVGMHSGLFLTAENEDEVASVLAHEIAHITQRHLLRSYEKARQMNIPMTIGMIAAALLGAADPQMGTAAAMAVQAGGVQYQLNFTRDNEEEADNLGMQILVRAGFNPMAMPAFFEKLQKAGRFYGRDTVPEFLRTHPVTTSRIADARGRAAQYVTKAHPIDALQFYLMREKLRVLLASDVNLLLPYYREAMQKGVDKYKHAVQYGYGLALAAAGHFGQARNQLQRLIDQDPERLAYQLALARIDIRTGQLAAALQRYQQMQQIYPDDQALTLEQVTALLQAGQPQQARQLLLKQRDTGTALQQVYQLLAKTEQALGHRSQAHRWLAEYYYQSGQLEQAIDQLQIAAKFAKGDEYQRAQISSRLREVEYQLAQMEKM